MVSLFLSVEGIALASMGLFFMAKKISQNLFWGLLAIIFCLPFERIPTLEISHFTLKINHLIGGLVIIFWILELLFKKRKIKQSSFGILLLILLFTLVISFFNSRLPSRSFIFLILDIFTFLLAFIVSQTVDTEKKFYQLERIFLISLGLVILFSLYQFFGDMLNLPLKFTGLDPGYSKAVFGFPRVQAFSKEPLYLGNLLLLGIGFCAAIFVNKRPFRFFYPFTVLLILIILLTVSRGALLGLIFFGLIWGIIYLKKILAPKQMTRLILGLIGGLIIFSAAFSLFTPQLRQTFFGHLSINDLSFGESTQGRLRAFSEAIEAFHTHPWLGVGLGNYGAFTVQYDLQSTKINDIVNNQYLELLAENGIIGLSAFLLLIFFVFLRSLRAIHFTKNKKIKNYLIALTLAWLAILLQYNFFSTLSILHIWIAFGLVVALQNLALQSTQSK